MPPPYRKREKGEVSYGEEKGRELMGRGEEKGNEEFTGGEQVMEIKLRSDFKKTKMHWIEISGLGEVIRDAPV
jgi:hypothetical protein